MDEHIEGSTSAELRAAYMEQSALPRARDVFGRDPGVRALLIIVSQHWCDEASDAVHIEEVLSAESHPRWPDVFEGNPFYCITDFGDGDRSHGHYTENERDNYARYGTAKTYDEMYPYPQLDSNSLAIPAFAAYCAEPGDQESPLQHNGTPYAVLRPSENGQVDVEILGKLHRPEWEDRFDVGFEVSDESVTFARFEGDWSEQPLRATELGPAAALEARRAAPPTQRPRSSIWRALRGLFRKR